MELIGMLDSPYVRRVAVSLQYLGVPFRHRALSVFRTFGEFRAINPVVKAPTLVLDDGTVLMDSTLILEYAESLVPGHAALLPRAGRERAAALRLVGLALAACEKSVQIIYERNLRPPERMHPPWIERVTGQLLAAYGALEGELESTLALLGGVRITQAHISTAVAWNFTQQTLPEVVPVAGYPRLAAFSARHEPLPEFAAAPFGDGTYQGREP